MAWQVQEAKQRPSELLRAAESGRPQVITRHDEDVAVVLDIAGHHRLRGLELALGESLRPGPVFDDLELERSSEQTRVVELGRPEAAE